MSKNPTHIFDRVVSIDLKVTLCIDLQIEVPVPRQLGQHVIEKRYTGCDAIFALTVQVEVDANIRFVGLPGFCRDSWIHDLFSRARSSALRNRSFSSGKPIDTLKHRSNSRYELTSRTNTPCLYSASNNSRAGFAVLIKTKFAFDGNTWTDRRF